MQRGDEGDGAFCYHAGWVIRDWPIGREQVRRLMQLSEERHFPCLILERDAMYINKVNRLVEEVQAGVSEGTLRGRGGDDGFDG